MIEDKPVIFKAAMVMAILNGSKTQTRRIVKTFDFMGDDCIHVKDHNNKKIAPLSCATMNKQPNVASDFCPYGKVGNRLWVRENFKVIDVYEGYDSGHIDDFAPATATIEYQDGMKKTVELSYNVPLANGKEIDEIAQAKRAFKKKTVPSIHMPRWASRIDLEITDIGVERLQDISEEDALAEGLKILNEDDANLYYTGMSTIEMWPAGWVLDNPIEAFKNLWDSINAASGFGWDKNPYVWVVKFKRHVVNELPENKPVINAAITGLQFN